MQYTDKNYGPARYTTIDAVTLTEAWVRARRLLGSKGWVVLIVFTVQWNTEYRQATELDFSTETGQGDPH